MYVGSTCSENCYNQLEISSRCVFKLRNTMSDWKVYHLTNHTKREVYHGVTKHSAQQRLDKSHCIGKTNALRHWDCENDDIHARTLADGLTQKQASAMAHQREQSYCQRSKSGYKCIVTRGK